jgi:hypothetical protein
MWHFVVKTVKSVSKSAGPFSFNYNQLNYHNLFGMRPMKMVLVEVHRVLLYTGAWASGAISRIATGCAHKSVRRCTPQPGWTSGQNRDKCGISKKGHKLF